MLRLSIRTKNAAFENHKSSEVARILRDLADRLDNADLTYPQLDGTLLRDLNGNTVGNVRVTD